MPPFTKKVDRNTDFGNPFRAQVFGGEEAVRRFKEYCPPDSPLAEAARHVLRGYNIGCWCKVGDPCHGDYLLKIANEDKP